MIKIHPYRWDPVKLLREVRKYDGGQVLIESTETSKNLNTYKMFRGEIERSEVTIAPGKKEIVVKFSWLCYKQFYFTGKEDRDELEILSDKRPWIEQPSHCNRPIIIGYTTYYPQKDEERIKVWTRLKETVHFFKPGDYTNLVKDDSGVFSSYLSIHRNELLYCLARVMGMNKKKGKK